MGPRDRRGFGALPVRDGDPLPASVESDNVMDEVNFALEKKKTVIPIIYRDCEMPLRLGRLQHVDLRQDYGRGLQELLKTLSAGQGAGPGGTAIEDVTDEPARLEDDRRKAAEQREGTGPKRDEDEHATPK
ncbi:MAG: TIR domain-containing protein [Terriglobales bacterium]|jgi:hypothetical protein